MLPASDPTSSPAASPTFNVRAAGDIRHELMRPDSQPRLGGYAEARESADAPCTRTPRPADGHVRCAAGRVPELQGDKEHGHAPEPTCCQSLAPPNRPRVTPRTHSKTNSSAGRTLAFSTKVKVLSVTPTSRRARFAKSTSMLPARYWPKATVPRSTGSGSSRDKSVSKCKQDSRYGGVS